MGVELDLLGKEKSKNALERRLTCGHFEKKVAFFGENCRCVALPALMAPREVYASSGVPPATDDSRTNSCRRERACAGSRVIG